jgi:hypothetical protein
MRSLEEGIVSKRFVSLRLTIILILSSFLAGGASGASQALIESKAAQAVDLKCKLVAGASEPRRSLWLIELRNAAGEPLRQALRMVGSTAHFKNLVLGIYRVCLSGKGGRRSAESIDLTLSENQKSLSISKVIRVPAGAVQVPGQHQVSIMTLAVPKDALEELKASGKSRDSADFEDTTPSFCTEIWRHETLADIHPETGFDFVALTALVLP